MAIYQMTLRDTETEANLSPIILLQFGGQNVAYVKSSFFYP